LAYIAKTLAGSPWDKVMILAVLLSIVGATQTAMVSGARIAFSMGSDRTLPPVLGTTHPRHRTPAIATLVFAALALAALWFYLLGSSTVQDSFSKVIGSVGLLFALFYAATGISVAVYYRRLALRGAGNFVQIGLIPIVSAAFLLWVAWKSIPGLGGWGGSILRYLYVMVALGIVLMLLARFGWRSSYFSQPVEAYEPDD
jgi:amino acid transporter